MNGITVIGPMGKQTRDDRLIEIIFNAFKGKGAEKIEAQMVLSFKILNELDDKDKNQERFDKNKARLITATYNLPESVYHNLEMTNYGVATFVPHLFPVIDSFSVVGKLDDTCVGFDLDFFPRDIQSTGTRVFARSPSKNLVQRLASEMFNFRDAQGKLAYSTKHTGEEIIDLKHYTGERRRKCSVCDGQLKFGLEKGKPYNDIVLEMMGFVNRHPHFSPESYILRHYDFKIDFSPEVCKIELSKRYDKLMERVKRVFEKKAQKNAA